MSGAVSIQGLAELERFMAQFPEKIQARVARNAMAAGARVIRDEAKKIVPVRTGALRRSIRSGSKRERDGMVTATIRAGRRGKKTDNTPFYAHMVEYGTKPHSIAPKNRKALKIGDRYASSAVIPTVRPKPYMRPALDGKWRQAVQTVADRIRERLDDVKQ